MVKTVRCPVTGEVGTSDVFFKKGKIYYSSEEAYLQHKERLRKQEELDSEHEKIYALVCKSILSIKAKKHRPPLLAKLLAVFNDCDPEIVCLAVELCGDRIAQKINEPCFTSAYGRFNYIVATLRNELSYAESVYEQRKFQKKRDASRPVSMTNMPANLENFGRGVKHPIKDITKLFQEDER